MWTIFLQDRRRAWRSRPEPHDINDRGRWIIHHHSNKWQDRYWPSQHGPLCDSHRLRHHLTFPIWGPNRWVRSGFHRVLGLDPFSVVQDWGESTNNTAATSDTDTLLWCRNRDHHIKPAWPHKRRSWLNSGPGSRQWDCDLLRQTRVRWAVTRPILDNCLCEYIEFCWWWHKRRVYLRTVRDNSLVRAWQANYSVLATRRDCLLHRLPVIREIQ